jgi:transcriptional regulator with XRE-family HTH domain
MDLRQVFATNLRRIRHEKGVSQEELAHDAEVDRAHVSRIERALHYAGLEVVEKFADVLGVEPAEFFRLPAKRAKRPRA